MKHKYKVLIVDDDEETVSMLKRKLEQEAYIVDSTQSAASAFEIVKSDKYHIVLISIEMSDRNGVALLKDIKSYDTLAQVIMMTGHSTMDKILTSLEYGANDYIQKPFASVEHVIQVINYSVEKLERWRTSILELVR